MIARSRIHTLINGGLYAAVFTIPFSLFVSVFKSNVFMAKTKIPHVRLCRVGRVHRVAVGYVQTEGFHENQSPPLPILAFAVIVAFSALLAGNILGSMKELIQVIDYFVIFPILFINNIVTREQIERVVLYLGAVSAVVVIYGLVQFALLAGKPYLVRSMFDNRNVLGGFLAMVIPLFFAYGGEQYEEACGSYGALS